MNIEQILAENCKVFVDESFLLSDAGRSFLLIRLLPELEKTHEERLILPERVYQNLLALSGNDRSLNKDSALEAVELISQFVRHKRLDRRGEDGEVSGKRVKTSDLFARLVYQFQLQYELAFLTLDEGCARALLATNRAESISHAKALRVLRFNDEQTRLDDWSKYLDRPVKKSKSGSHRHVLDVESLVVDSKVFIDTCSLMTASAEQFVTKKLIPALEKSGNRLIVAHRVLAELEKHVSRNLAGLDTESQRDALRAQKSANTGLSLIELLKSKDLVDIRREENEVIGNEIFFDALIQRVFVQHQKNVKLVLITQDTKLAKQILENACNLGVGDSPPKIGFINEIEKKDIAIAELGNWEWRFTWKIYDEDGKSAPFGHKESSGIEKIQNLNGLGPLTSETENRNRSKSSHTAQKKDHKHASQRVKPFKLAHGVYRGDTSLIHVNSIPGEGSEVIGDESGLFQLTSKLNEGGEGTIYKTSIPNIVCKIYFKERLTEDRRTKLELMVSRKSPEKTICWPLELVKNMSNEFVGYLMPMAKGEIFNLTVFKKPLLEETFPAWRREHLVQLGITTLGIVKKLHDLNVLIGDINPNNFMIVSENEVYLVDTDSFQIEEFPCLVGTPHFTPPELIGKSYGDFLRTKEHEVFAVATLLFMIIFPGKPPYSGQGGGDVVESIKNHKFPYVTEEGERSSKPFGPYKFIWSHLHHLLRQDFREIFYDGRRTPLPEKDEKLPFRSTTSYVDRFLDDLKMYLASIRKGRNSNELFPEDNYLRSDQEIIEIPCGDAGCLRSSRLTKEWHDELLAQNSKRIFRCPKHTEINRLKHETIQFNKDMRQLGRGSSTVNVRRPPSSASVQSNPYAYLPNIPMGTGQNRGWSRPNSGRPSQALQLPKKNAGPTYQTPQSPSQALKPSNGGVVPPAYQIPHQPSGLPWKKIALGIFIGWLALSIFKPSKVTSGASPVNTTSEPTHQAPVNPTNSVGRTAPRSKGVHGSGQNKSATKISQKRINDEKNTREEATTPIYVLPHQTEKEVERNSTSIDINKYRDITRGF